VHPVLRGHARSAEHMMAAAEHELLSQGLIREGDVLGVVAGTQMASGSTNFFRLHTVTAEEAKRAGRRVGRGRPTIN